MQQNVHKGSIIKYQQHHHSSRREEKCMIFAITNLLGSPCKKYGHHPERNITQNDDQSIELIRNNNSSLILEKIMDQIILYILYLLESSDTCQACKCTAKLISVQNPKISHAERQLCSISFSKYAGDLGTKLVTST
jgi:hypothetical protein